MDNDAKMRPLFLAKILYEQDRRRPYSYNITGGI